MRNSFPYFITDLPFEIQYMHVYISEYFTLSFNKYCSAFVHT